MKALCQQKRLSKIINSSRRRKQKLNKNNKMVIVADLGDAKEGSWNYSVHKYMHIQIN